jgi:16S rRNA (adenine1518-N6/adenine1519-N6)-dimethyltransferase
MKAKKSLGQNFLKSKTIINKIADAGHIGAADTVLEIGPGKGILTEALLQRAAKVIAVEIDERMLEILNDRFAKEVQEKKLNILHGDITEFDTKAIKGNYKLIGNIPYYITGEIIRKFLDSTHKPETIVFLVQKEVAERIVARDGKQSILSLSVAVYGKARTAGTVKAKYFSPAPKVDSSILVIENITEDSFQNISSVDFFLTIHKGFSHKRKVVLNNFSGDEKDIIRKYLDEKNIRKDIRAENLTLNDWLNISRLIKTGTGHH